MFCIQSKVNKYVWFLLTDIMGNRKCFETVHQGRKEMGRARISTKNGKKKKTREKQCALVKLVMGQKNEGFVAG